MTISSKSSAEFASELEDNIISRNSDYDTKIGPIPDLVINPLANVLELQNERIKSVQSLLSLVNDGSFTDTDLDEFVYNETMKRLSGAKSTVTLVFSRLHPPTVDITVSANFPVATLQDETTGASTIFLTIADATMIAANATSYYNPDTKKYELLVPAVALQPSEDANVGPNRVTRPLRPLNNFDTVFNRDSAIGGHGAETNGDLIDRYYLSLIGSSPAVVNGVEKILRNNYPQVIDSNEVYGNNTLNVRSATDGGAVDVYVIGSSAITYTETIVFPGRDQVISLSKQPVISITSAGAYTPDVDYILVKDTSGNAGSIRGADGIMWLTTGSAPAIGASVSVTYTYNSLLQALQDVFTQSDKQVPGRDILYKEATQIDVALNANLKIRSGFSVSAVTTAVTNAIQALFDGYKLSDDVEASDIQAVVRAFSSVDNFVITNLSKVGTTGNADILISANEYARISSSDLVITIV